MKKLLTITLILISLSTNPEPVRKLTLDFYIQIENGVFKASKIWFNIPKNCRQIIIDSLYRKINSYDTPKTKI